MSNSGGEYCNKPPISTAAPKSLVPKAPGFSQPVRRRGPTIVPERALSFLVVEDQKEPTISAGARRGAPRPRPPDARERRAIRQKQARREKKRETFLDAAAFAYYMEWPLNMRITVTWDACAYGDRRHGHVLGEPDKKRCECLRDAVRKHLRKVQEPFACIWARDTGGRYGQHIHLALHWSLPVEELAWLLADLTGSLPSSGRLSPGVVARSECGGWQIQHNTARDEIPSALRWTDYLLDQEARHLFMPEIDGTLLGVSRDIDTKAMVPHREALEVWKRQKDWIVGEEPMRLQEPDDTRDEAWQRPMLDGGAIAKAEVQPA